MSKTAVAAMISSLALAACSSGDGSTAAASTVASDGGSTPATDGGSTASADGGAAASCTPAGSPQIRSGGTIGPATAPSSCVSGVQQSSSQAQKLGTHTVGDVVSFTVPAGASSFSIVSQAVGTPIDTITYAGSDIPNSVVPTI